MYSLVYSQLFNTDFYKMKSERVWTIHNHSYLIYIYGHAPFDLLIVFNSFVLIQTIVDLIWLHGV